jgi:hypothetical protein
VTAVGTNRKTKFSSGGSTIGSSHRQRTPRSGSEDRP